jgi:hypothetical protein
MSDSQTERMKEIEKKMAEGSSFGREEDWAETQTPDV